MNLSPSVMDFGTFSLISPDGSETIPADLWPELELEMLLNRTPGAAWLNRLQANLDRDARVRARATAARPWTILCVSPNMERKVEETLREAGLSIYVPIEKYRPANTWRSRTRPLMPGYLFADLACDEDLDIARKNHAVRRIMCQDGRPVRVPASEIERMARAEANGDYDRTKRESGARKGSRRGRRGTAQESRWKKGQRVRIGEGPFAGLLAEIVGDSRGDLVEVEVSVFGRWTPITLDEAMIEGGDHEDAG